MSTMTAVVVMLTDSQLDEEIEAAASEVCCPNSWAAAVALCGCGGRAQQYLDRLIGEATRRDDEQVPS